MRIPWNKLNPIGFKKSQQRYREAHRDKCNVTRQKHPERYKARMWTSNAIRDGRLKRGRCEVCGSVFTEAHHEDYSKPEKVKWLCKKHHEELHESINVK